MFDRKRLFNNIEKNLANILDSEFLNFVKADIIDRLDPIEKKCERVIVIRDHENYISNRISDRFMVKEIINIDDEELIAKCEGKYDMIVFPFGLHWTNKVQEFLASCALKLKDDGLLICNFCGAGTLNSLKKTFYDLEEENSAPHAAHIIPMIKFDQVTPLLQQAGFIENIIDMEKLDLEFDSPMAMMKAIKNTAQSNILSQNSGYSINRKMYDQLQQNSKGKYIDNVNLVTFLAAKNKNTISIRPER